MRSLSILVAVAASASLVLQAGSGSAAPLRAKICGQVHGPPTAWTDRTPWGETRYSGSTWTVFVGNVRCSRGMTLAPAMLRAWSQTRVGGKVTVSGWRCSKLPGAIVCLYPEPGVPLTAVKSVNARMYAPLTLAEIKQRFG